MKTAPRTRRILHLDLDPFFVSVERSRDPGLRGRPVVVGGLEDGTGMVAAASAEARVRGVRPGQAIRIAQRICPDAVFRPGDLEAYARVSDEVTSLLLAASRRVERPSSDEAYVDLTRETPTAPHPVSAAEAIKDDIQRRLGLDASLGLASSRLGARIASAGARPRGLLVVLPGYEHSFVGRQPVSLLPDLPAHLEKALVEAGVDTIGQVAAADPAVLTGVVGAAVAARLQRAATAEDEEPVPVAAPPLWVQEETTVRDRRADQEGLREMIATLARRGVRRLRPFSLAAGTLSIEVRKPEGVLRRVESFEPGIADEETAAAVAASLCDPLLSEAGAVRSLQVRLSRLAGKHGQVPLFPEASGSRG
jgi:DNA polymerase IV